MLACLFSPVKQIYKLESYNHNKYFTLRNWWHEFLNYFKSGVTPGFVEDITHAIRYIIWRAFRYRNFGNFQLQVLVECDSSG